MAWLFLDSRERGRIRYGWLAKNRVHVRAFSGRAGDLLIKMAKNRRRLSRASGICVVAGPGSFSAVRTGVLFANLLSRLLKRPLVGVRREEAEDLTALSARLHDHPLSSSYVAPSYDAEPNITIQTRA